MDHGKKKMMGGGYNKYSKGGNVKDGNKMARREYSKGGVASAMKTAKPC